MILHIAHDDKFIDMAYNMFEKATPNNNEFIIATKQKSFKYIKTTPATKITPLKLLSKSFAKRLTQYEFVVLHWLDDFKKQLILNAPKDVKFLWIGWGGDYYCYLNKNLFLPVTEQLVKNIYQNNFHLILKSKIKSFIKQKLLLRDIKNLEEVINRINYFAPVLEEDYNSVASYFKEFKPKYISWNYGTLEDDLIKTDNKNITGANILIGNSATPENNHLDILNMLKKIGIGNRKIIIPLSYGDMVYKKHVEKKAQDFFGDKVEILKTFIPILDYNKIIQTCSIVIMNHLRQQALGNIVTMMYYGAKIFLNKESPVYSFFKKNGAIIFNLDEIKENTFNDMLTSEEVLINRKILEKYWSREVILKKTLTLIETLRNNNL